VIVAVAAILLSGLNLGLRLWNSANAWWMVLLGGSFIVGAAVVVRLLVHPDDVSPWASRTIQLSFVVVPLQSLGLWFGDNHGPIPNVAQACAAGAVIGMGTGVVWVVARGQLRLAPDHQVSVGLYSNSVVAQTLGSRMLGPSDDDDDYPEGFYQARCRCGWRGPRHVIDDDDAESAALADSERHERTFKVAASDV